MDPNVPEASNPIEFGPFRLIASQRRLERNGVAVKLGSRALDILTVLTQQAGQIVDKQELLARVWPGVVVEENTLRVHIKDLRRILEDGVGDHSFIVNVPGRGYGFVARDAEPPVITPDTPSPVKPEQRLPPRPQRVIGRDDAVDAVTALLADKRFVTLHGPGGIGKTTLASVVAHEQCRRFGDAVFFVDLGTLAGDDFVPAFIASTLGLNAPLQDPTTTLVHALKDRRMLLVLDSCEHVIDAVADLAERIFQWAPNVSLLTTSREALRVDGEYIFSVEPLELPCDEDEASPEEVLSSPAVSFFVQHAQASGPSFDANDANARLVAHICRRLDGIALAMELAARWAGMHGLQETAALLDSRLQLEWKGRRTASPRHQTLSAMLDWSHDLISEPERRLLQRLSVFVGAFALDDARIVAGDEDMTDLQVVDTLGQLVAKSLISSHADRQGARYRLLDTTRAYAHAKLAASGGEPSVRYRHAAHCTEFLQRTSADLSGEAAAERRDARAAYLGNVRAALDWCFSPAGDTGLGVALACAASSLFIELSLIGECRRWTEQALACMGADIRESRLELELQAALGYASTYLRGNGEQAQTALERGLQIAGKLEDRVAEFRLVSRLHMFHARRGELGRLLPISERALEIAAHLQDPVALAAAHILHGVGHHFLGDQAKARIHLEDPIHQVPAVRQVTPSHFAFHRNPQIAMARVHWLQGHADQALQIADRVVQQIAPNQDAITCCIALIWSASVYEWVGDWATVEDTVARLLDQAERHGLKLYHAVGSGLRGKTMIVRGDLDSGIGLLREALANLRLEQYELYTPGFAGALAEGMATKGQQDQALSMIGDTLARLELRGGSFCVPELMRVRGEILEKSALERAAIQTFQQAVALSDTQGTLAWRLRAATSLARLRARQGHRDEALQLLEDTYRRFDEGFETADLQAAKTLIDSLQ